MKTHHEQQRTYEELPDEEYKKLEDCTKRHTRYNVTLFYSDTFEKSNRQIELIIHNF